MRPKVVVAILSLACCFLGITVVILRVLSHEPVVEDVEGNLPETPTKTRVAPGKEFAVPPDSRSLANDKAPVVSSQVSQGANRATSDAAYARKRVAELMDLAMNNDSASLNVIWTELSNPDKEIRVGALEAVVQFGDRLSVPRLRKLAVQTADPEEKKAILEAADYLELPTLDELPALQKTGRPADAQAGFN